MILSETWEIFLFAFLGGVAAEAVGWWELCKAKPNEFPQYLKQPFYWIMTAIMAGLGGLLAVSHHAEEMGALLAINIGASAPLVLKSLARSLPNN